MIRDESERRDKSGIRQEMKGEGGYEIEDGKIAKE